MSDGYRHIPTVIVEARPDWRYLLDGGDVRPATEAEQALYAQRHKDGFYAALLDGTTDDEPDAFEGTGWTQAEVDAALAGNARRSYEEAGRPDDVPPAGADPS